MCHQNEHLSSLANLLLFKVFSWLKGRQHQHTKLVGQIHTCLPIPCNPCWSQLNEQRRFVLICAVKHESWPRRSQSRLVLQRDAWEQHVVAASWRQHRIPCPYTFKWSYDVYHDPMNHHVYIRITAHCTECGATAEGTILDEPAEGESVSLTERAPNTVGRLHLKNI